MPNQIQKTTVLSAVNGVHRVEIATADRADTENAKEAVTIIAAVRGSENPTLIDLQRAALNRARALIDESTTALEPPKSA
jgi:hypothetical protein